MPRRGTEIGIAKGLCSSEAAERTEAIGSFVRLFTCSAPTDLALLATRFTDVPASYRGDRPLAEHLLERLPIRTEVSVAWRIALLEGAALSRALGTFDELCGPRLRKQLERCCRDPDDVYQRLLLQILTQRRFRLTCFGKYAGEGSLSSYLRTALVREAARQSRRQARQRNAAEVLEGMEQGREESPERAAVRHELRTDLMAAFRQLAHDPGFLPFVLQQGFGMRATDVADILQTSDNTVRQWTFRFRRRLRGAWKHLHPHIAYPFRRQDGTAR
ncbi:MAG: hypothetical protein AMK75_03365 [Planctomycetes bacterium SM23_65]|nr:MAG: hypothetical protein AMK75_03365 [Planctomycetes bacterium SM23_65]